MAITVRREPHRFVAMRVDFDQGVIGRSKIPQSRPLAGVIHIHQR
jgi:hypothetical protein